MKKSTAWGVIIIVLLVLGGVYYLWEPGNAFSLPTPAQTGSTGAAGNAGTPIATAVYQCDNGHTISATYYQGATPATTTPGEPPTPTGSVSVSLDGGAPVTLNQTISADGTRYSDGDPSIAQGEPGAETFVFWSKGNQALVMENNTMDLTYSNCTAPQQQ